MGTIGAECNEEAMIYFALLPPAGYTASPVKYVQVMSDWLHTQYWPGAVTVVVGSDTGPLPLIDLTAVQPITRIHKIRDWAGPGRREHES